jgi:hypothetical protein
MKNFFVIYALIALMVSCSTPHLAVEGLETEKETYDVKGRQGWLLNQHLSFGSYQSSKVNRSWTKGSGFLAGISDVVWAGYERKKQTFRFGLNDASSNKSEVFAITKLEGRDITIGGDKVENGAVTNGIFGIELSSSNNFAATITVNAGDPWELIVNNELAQERPSEVAGTLRQSKENYYEIVPVRNFERNGKSHKVIAGSIGYEFRNRLGQTVAAVSLLDNGRVYFGNISNEEKFLLANACAALLLQESI